ncbi:TrmH family RNA methyltransferase [Knoellia sp. Soil729]|uniref:TrmH family RNA methyltransferase n=1 Tax=Knoellia sp. Soil729 TaxID=1736394 RepID=UPI0007003DB3|nr:RNA methyltransferase [Knoellia sp. Soil729]KRE43303.1 RNA methyltransferase [Knoellia sp. Soil729]
MLTNVRSDRVKSVRSLSRRSARERTGRFVVDGPQGVREAIRCAAPRVDDLYVTPSAVERHNDLVGEAQDAGIHVHEVDDAVLAAMSDTESPQGLLAVVASERPTLDDVLAGRPQLLVLLSNVRDPGNAGTVIRGADAFGADAVLVSDGSVDVLSPKVVRSTVGSLFHLPVVTGLDVDATLGALSAHGIRTFAADGVGETLLPDVDVSQPHAWVLGNEAWGLPAEIRDRCTDVVRVPISPRVESLNLAMAATICLATSSGATRRP